jgi:cyclophilin family peptidyl-prolyl cis-trans isomerase/HEAT repeat protein
MKKFLTVLAFSSVVLICYESVIAQPIDSIAELQNSRSLVDGKLYGYFHSSNPSVRSRAVVALANIQDSSSIQFLLPLLNDSNPAVRRSTAFALGQIGNSDAGSHLIERIQSESDSKCVQEIIDATGKCGSKENLETLIKIAPTFFREAQSSVALSLARFAIRRIKDSLATEYVASLIGHSESTQMAVYAMMRIGDSLSVKHHLPALLSAMNDHSPEIRMWTATLIGLVNDSIASAVVINHAFDDPDWRVRVNCVRSLRNQRVEEVLPVLIALMADRNEHVALTAFSVLNSDAGKYSSDNLVKNLQKILPDPVHYSWRQRGEASVLLAKLLKERSLPQLTRFLDGNLMFRSKIIAALGETKSVSAISVLQNELLNRDPRSVSAAVESYRNIVAGKDSAVQSEFCQKILPLLQRHDISILYSVAAAIEDTSIRASIRFRCLPEFITAYQNLSTPDDVEVMVEFINLFVGLKADAAIPLLQRSLRDNDRIVAKAAASALQVITGKNYEAEISSFPDTAKFYKSEDVALLKHYHSASLITPKGSIRIEFRPDAAPFTVLNFMLLAKKHFYDGLMFHRVVPTFVIQGGDPLGTGFGGPGYAIRTEVHPDALYTEGAVGMASAGKDTEGSQFFITHCPTPHLDGRYTVFGYTKDMDIVDKIQIGDTIISVKLME